MKYLVEYVKFTMALAIGLIAYVSGQFLPRGWGISFFIILITVILLTVSTFAAIMLYSRATKLLLSNQTEDDKNWIKLWGRLHLGLLAISFIIFSCLFVSLKMFPGESALGCEAEIPLNYDERHFIVNFDCSIIRDDSNIGIEK